MLNVLTSEKGTFWKFWQLTLLRVILKKKKKGEVLDSLGFQGFDKNQGDAIITVDRETPSPAATSTVIIKAE